MAVPFLLLWGKKAAAVVTPPVDQPGAGGTIVGGTFSRGRWRKLRDEWDAAAQAQEATERKAQEVTGKRRKALEAAARAAENVILAAAEAEHEAEILAAHAAQAASLARMLDAAVNAKTLAQSIKLSNAARDFAMQVLDEIEDDEDDIAVLLIS